MYILKGFIAIPELTDNAVGQVSPLGEISKDSMTYAKETGFYKNNSYPNVFLHAFNSRSDEEGVIAVPDTYRDLALAMGQFIFDAAAEGEFRTASAIEIVNAINTEFEDSVADVEVGGALEADDYRMPSWVTFSANDDNSYIRLWFADQAFSTQYDEFEYEFIPPIDDIDDFFGTKEQVESVLSQSTFKRLVDAIDQKRGENPFTVARTQEYNWVNPTTEIDGPTVGWTAIVYGGAGDDPDQIRLALIDWILANSNHTRDEWLQIFPSIFVPTEFIITPLWHLFAIANQTIQSGLNSPVVGLQQALDIAKVTCLGTGYAEDQLMENTMVGVTPQDTLAFLATGSGANRNDLTNFRIMHPDYIGVPLSSADFGRMSEQTQAWVRMFVDMLAVAEDMDTYTQIPNGYSRVIREGMVYTVKSFNGMQYLVATRSAVLRALEVEAPYTPAYS